MNYFIDVEFWASTILIITAATALLSSVRLQCKSWMVGFLVLSQLTMTAHYVSILLFRNHVMTERIIKDVNALSWVFSIGSWALLLTFILSLRSRESLGTTVGSAGAVAAETPPHLTDPPYKGYGGWLAFFSAVHLFIQPIFAVIMLAIGTAGLSEAKFPGLIAIFIFEALGSIVVVGLGMRAAVKLRGIRPNAVRTTKLYLLVALAWSFLAIAFPYTVDIPDRYRGEMTLEYVKGFVKAIIIFTIWFSYFSVSKRVKATYVD